MEKQQPHENWNSIATSHIFKKYPNHCQNFQHCMILLVWGGWPEVKGTWDVHGVPVILTPIQEVLILGCLLPSFALRALVSCMFAAAPTGTRAPDFPMQLCSSRLTRILPQGQRRQIKYYQGSFRYKWQETQLKVA